MNLNHLIDANIKRIIDLVVVLAKNELELNGKFDLTAYGFGINGSVFNLPFKSKEISREWYFEALKMACKHKKTILLIVISEAWNFELPREEIAKFGINDFTPEHEAKEIAKANGLKMIDSVILNIESEYGSFGGVAEIKEENGVKTFGPIGLSLVADKSLFADVLDKEFLADFKKFKEQLTGLKH